MIGDNNTRAEVAVYAQFRVIFDPLVHRPWGLYRIYLKEKYIGAQISFPNKSDCECISRNAVRFAFGSPDLNAKPKKNRGVTSPEHVLWRKQKAAA